METTYYNAKPSQIGNLGADVTGAKRMNFDTYENPQEKAKRKAQSKELKGLKEKLKDELFQDQPDTDELIALVSQIFKQRFSVDINDSDAVADWRNSLDLGCKDSVKEFNVMIGSLNRTRRDIQRLKADYYSKFQIERMRKRYKAKSQFTENTGAKLDWSSLEVVKGIDNASKFLEENSRAVQFGNSVTDKERLAILDQLSQFITKWQGDNIFGKTNLKGLAWSFGARGKRGSVAYYQPGQRLISVNRHNIGSIVHEIGHHIDHENNLISSRISAETVREYRKLLKEQGVKDAKSLNYYCDRKEIFARAFEAYCYKVKAGFSSFAQCGDAYLPELSDELINIVSSALSTN